MVTDTPPEKSTGPKATNHNPRQRVDDIQSCREDIHLPHPPKTVNTKRDSFEWWKFAVEILTLVFIAAYAIIASCQLDYMREATNASKKSADAAASAVFVAQSTMYSNQRSGESTLKEMKAQRKAMQIAAGAAKTQSATSKKAAEAAEYAMHIIEAADISRSTVVCSPIQEPLGLKTEVSVVFKNTGKTQAIHYKHRVFLGIREQGGPYKATSDIISEMTLGAGDSRQTAAFVISDLLTDEMLKQVNAGTLKLYLYGWAIYEDKFGIKHNYSFHSKYQPNSNCNFLITNESSN